MALLFCLPFPLSLSLLFRLKRPRSKMSDPDSIAKAADVINNILFARGYFPPASDDEDEDPKLLFQTINKDQLQTEKQVYDNDKLLINTVYSLLQELDHHKTERQYLTDQLADKEEIIKHLKASNKDHNEKSELLQRDNVHKANEAIILRQSIKSLKQEKTIHERQFQAERKLNSSLMAKFDVEMKKKNILIEKLQDKLLSKRVKFQSIMERNNHSVNEYKPDEADSKLVLDDEMEKMMVNLSDLITSMTQQNTEGTHLINFIHSYLTVLTDHMIRRIQNSAGGLPPTPKFFFDNMKQHTQQDEPVNADLSSKMSHVVDLEKLTPTIMDTLDKLYELMTNEVGYDFGNEQGSSERVTQLQKEIAVLRSNLDVAMETNEKWSNKFLQLNKEKNQK